MKLTTIDPQLQVEASACQRSPGMVLRDDHMLPRGLSTDDLAQLSGIPAWHLRRIMLGLRIFTEEALQLANALQTSALYWLVLQACYDLERAERDAAQDELVH